MSQANQHANARRLFLITAILALPLAVGWCALHLGASREAAAQAVADLASAQDIAGRIALLRQRPVVADAREAQGEDISRRIEEAAREAGVEETSLERIEPEPARRLGDTPYREKPTRLRLRHVTLQQLFQMLHALASEAPGSSVLRLSSFRLSAPHGEEAGDEWMVESTLSCLVYDPKLSAASSPKAAD
jgi:hypothetical protein